MARRNKVPPVLIEFSVEDLRPVTAVMAELAAPPSGFLTLQPAFDADEAPPQRRGSGFFTARGPYVPIGNWVPGERSRNGIDYTAIGIQHGNASKVIKFLAENGLVVPTGWEVMSDHPARGLVVAVPPAEDHAKVLGWIIDAGDRLCPIQLTGEWRATVHRRRDADR
jgi:hypothetical protein